MVDHREPPKPANWTTPRKGTCRFCQLPVLNEDGTVNTRTQWHPICVVDYQMIYWPAVTRKAVWMRDGGRCAQCGHRCPSRGAGVWHLDHIQPLIEAHGDIRYWQMGNLQTLCQACHIAKTSREAGERALVRRQAKLGEVVAPQLFSPPLFDETQRLAIRDRLSGPLLRKKPPRRRRR